MLEHHVNSPVTRRRLRSGPAAEHLDGFADWLHRHGYRPASVDSIFRSLASWTDWMQSAGFTVHDCPAGLAACAAELQAGGRVRYRRGPNNHSLASAALFIRFLQVYGVLPPPAILASPTDLWPLIGEFRSWMRQHRGLTETTLDVYQPIITELLTALGGDPRLYTAEVLRGFALERARRHGLQRAKTVVVAVRAFLRFLGATQQCTPGMQYAIPGFASWQLSTVPRFLAADDVEQVIASCPADGNGPRDKAVLLLLARLGLRAGEVARLRFADIDWTKGLLTVSGKARRQEKLPLPQEVGDALLHYVRQSRPPLRTAEVFTTVVAPVRPLTRAAVTHIVRAALRRAGIKAPINGAHVLRHSAATAMLRQGASLAGIGAVLRHRSPRTTAHYAKVDLGLLSEITQPWPEVV
ncbi:MAG TPA: tyrosine-type recombinase/integrase [Stellaceae bacterium]|nr:tyrosine-type recombinase/integrase [Stellaceae bacterium]